MQDPFSLISYSQDDLTILSGADLDVVLAGVEKDRYSWLIMKGYSEVDGTTGIIGILEL